MFDLIIKNAKVFDGLGNPPIQADVAISDGVIREIDTVNSKANQMVDAKGLSLMPGIVDLHTHFDAQVTWDKTLSPSPALGVTTAVMGNCGFGIAPCPAPLRETMLKNLCSIVLAVTFGPTTKITVTAIAIAPSSPSFNNRAVKKQVNIANITTTELNPINLIAAKATVLPITTPRIWKKLSLIES